MSSKCLSITRNIDWDINDTSLPKFSVCQNFEEWVDGHCRLVYSAHNEQAKKHSSGWAMRNTNNHNVQILKKSCLGVLVCSQNCVLDSGQQVHVRPAICDKARRKQQGKPCPNRNCSGKLQVLPCRGHCGYPVTHFWRHQGEFILFQSKGNHDHPRPEPKNSSDMKRMASLKALKNSSLFANGYSKRLSSKLKQANSLSTSHCNTRKSYPPPMLSKIRAVTNPLTSNSSFNCALAEPKAMTKSSMPHHLTQSPTNVIHSNSALISDGYKLANKSSPATEISRNTSEHKNYNGVSLMSTANTSRPNVCNTLDTVPSKTFHSLNPTFSSTEYSFTQTLPSFHQTVASQTPTIVTSGPIYPSALHLSSSLSSSTCSSVEIQPPFMQSISFAVPSSKNTIASSSILPADVIDTSPPNLPNDVMTNFNYFGSYPCENAFSDHYDEFKYAAMPAEIYPNAANTDNLFNKNNNSTQLFQDFYKSEEVNKCIDPVPVFDPYSVQCNSPQIYSQEPKINKNSSNGTSYYVFESGSTNSNTVPVVPLQAYGCHTGESDQYHHNQYMYPNSAYNVNMERTTSGDINDNTFHPPMSLQSRYISFEWNPDKHNSNVEKNCSFSETAYKPDTTSQRLHPLQSYHRQLDSLEPNNSALDSKPETVQTNYWALNQMDVLYANDILSLDSPHIKQEAFHCSNGELASSALYPIPPPNAPASSPHSQISTRNREPHAFCHYNDIFELNNCPTDDYVVTFLK